MTRGACRDEDPEIFFPIAEQGPALAQVSAAKAVCLRCAVSTACLSFGLQTSQEGIWGGTAPGSTPRLAAPPACRRPGRPVTSGSPRSAGHAGRGVPGGTGEPALMPVKRKAPSRWAAGSPAGRVLSFTRVVQCTASRAAASQPSRLDIARAQPTTART
jgi:hypothetical protein